MSSALGDIRIVSDPIVIHGTPPVTDATAVRLADMLGNGTEGVCSTNSAMPPVSISLPHKVIDGWALLLRTLVGCAVFLSGTCGFQPAESRVRAASSFLNIAGVVFYDCNRRG